jgi:hypothetical protein
MKAIKYGVYKVVKVGLTQNAADGIEDVANKKADGFNEYHFEENADDPAEVDAEEADEDPAVVNGE